MQFLPAVIALTLGVGLGLSFTVQARDERLKMSVAEATATPEAQAQLTGKVKFYWGDQPHPKGRELGSFTANKKTNFFNKSNKEGCEWAWLSAMVALQERAIREGGDAVVNIHSVYRNEVLNSRTEYDCGAGAVVGGVALRGTVVKLP